MKKTILIITVIIILVSFVYFITTNKNKNASKIVSQPKKPTIVTSFYPLYYFASQIVGNKMTVINISRGNDPHEFKPSTKDIALMHNADIVLLQGAGLESWGEDLKQQLKKEKIPVFVATEHLKLFKFDEKKDQNKHTKEKTEKNLPFHNDEHTENHHQGAYDPHTWLSPVLAKKTVLLIAKKIETLDPKNKDTYQRNAQILANKLDELDTAYKNQLAKENCSTNKALVSHNAFGYIGRRYGLDMYPIAGISTLDKPSAQLLAQLKNKAQEGALAILTEENSVKKYAETIAKETGLKMLPVNALATGVIKNNGDYIDGMYANLKSFKQAYGCKK